MWIPAVVSYISKTPEHSQETYTNLSLTNEYLGNLPSSITVRLRIRGDVAEKNNPRTEVPSNEQSIELLQNVNGVEL